ncbi:hypothetical protein BJ138DRAFT_1150284 [Hygrophoropsis aurantiaca]|uniref:Uncharacterized protein n=1 Tax=Hygrophoropsis aurantiaca TaxID=72124 RepID=A0ACB8AE82_9AGAM|nr:hypothetical protein BJ138DRAFT_1150284 [Hygrophoropsis aurantiaca]
MATPPLPALQDQILIDVFCYRLSSGLTDTPYGNTIRLADLGRSVLEMVIMTKLFYEKPMLDARDITIRKDDLLGADTASKWLGIYELKKKVRGAPDVLSKLDSPEESLFLLHSYVGAVYSTQGLKVVNDWICKLIDPDSEPTSLPENTRAGSQVAPVPGPSTPVRARLGSPPPQSPPAALAQFNQLMATQFKKIEWSAASVGPSHQPTWSASCIGEY